MIVNIIISNRLILLIFILYIFIVMMTNILEWYRIIKIIDRSTMWEG